MIKTGNESEEAGGARGGDGEGSVGGEGGGCSGGGGGALTATLVEVVLPTEMTVTPRAALAAAVLEA